MMVELENNLRFVSNFRYDLRANETDGKDVLKFPFKKLAKMITDTSDDATKARFDSVCNSTMVGFVQDKSYAGSLAEHPITCFYASRDESSSYNSQLLA